MPDEVSEAAMLKAIYARATGGGVSGADLRADIATLGGKVDDVRDEIHEVNGRVHVLEEKDSTRALAETWNAGLEEGAAGERQKYATRAGMTWKVLAGLGGGISLVVITALALLELVRSQT